MSWAKKPGGPPAEQPGFAPQQQYNNQQNMYPNYAGAQQPAQMWPPQQQQQQFKPNYPPYQQEYSNANQMYPQQYNQNYTQGYNQPGYQQYYPNMQQQANPAQNPTDSWEDNWDWGWDESAKQAQLAAQNAGQPQQPFNNANVIEESFASTDTWNWSMDDKKEPVKPEVTSHVENNKPESVAKPLPEEVKLSDKEAVKERVPNLALGRRFHTENLTPQWSIESQMSQESSEGPHTHSESTYRSENQSRNSTKSSPGLNTDAHFNFPHDEAIAPIAWPTPTPDEMQNIDRDGRKSHDELASSLQEMTITNAEPLPDKEVRSAPEQPSPSKSPGAPVAMPPPPPVTAAIPPPTNFPPNQNPFKNTGSFSHKTTSSKSTTPNQPFPGLTSPAAVNKVQHRPPVGFGANLETTPDNSERPDQPQVPFRPATVSQQVPDNLEVAPQNDRNEYLQTAHLSGDYGENTDFSRGLPPPPGLRRMVVGQQESEYGAASADEPPPGLARMVPGQQTESDNSYSQPSDNYMDRHIDGQPTDENPRPYRQADGQPTSEYTQPTTNRNSERRPVGSDRMVPGNDDYTQYPAGYNNDQRVVTGLDHDYPIPGNAGPSDIREQNVDGSDYTESTPRNPFANVSNDVSAEYNGPPEEQQREVLMEGENLQDLSAIAPNDMPLVREQGLDGADANADTGGDRKTDLSETDHPTTSSRRQSINRVTSGEDSERDRYKSSPRRDRDKHKSSRDKERDRDGRYSRDSRGKYEREGERRSLRRGEEKERRRDREESPEGRKVRRSTRSHRYETEDTDYYSDRDRDRRRYREGSYAKPPRPDDYRRDDRRRHNTTERRYDDDDRRRYGRYRDIDPTRKYGRRDDDRRGEPYSPSRAESRDAAPTDDELNDTLVSADGRRRDRDRHRRRQRPDAYYDGYSGVYADPYALQRQQYQYYEHLRLTNPARYMEIYKQIMAGQPPPPPPPEYLAAANKITALDGYGSLGYDGRVEERGSVHSGRSSANGLKGTDTYYGYRHDASLRDAPSLRTDLSDRDLNTDASMTLHLDESTVRSERMTPFKFSTAHVKGNISSRHVVVVRPSYPVDGLPATVQILSLPAALADDVAARELRAFPGPLIKGVTHKKSVIEYCASRVRNAHGRSDVIGYVLIWELLALMLRQNGVVVGTDIAELLMKNKRDFEYNPGAKSQNADRRGSSVSEEDVSAAHASDLSPPDDAGFPRPSAIDEKTAVDQLREYLTYGNRQDAIEWAMSHQLWGHAFALSAHADRRTRGAVAARFLSGVPRADPLHTLYHALAGRTPPVATCASDERWGDWRPHAAIILSNASAKPESDTRTLTQLGDTLSSRGLLYSAQFCYVSARVPFAKHPMSPFSPPTGPSPPPRLALLLADSRANSLAQLATNEAVFATEIYEYALSLSQDYCIQELQAYKFLIACRLVDAGEYERALAYTEALARAVMRTPRDYPQTLVAQLAALADRLKYHDPALHEEPPLAEEGDSGEPSPRHQQWLGDVAGVAQELAAEAEAEAEASRQATPAHRPAAPAEYYSPPQYGWAEAAAQPQHMYNPQPTQPVQSAYPEPYQPEEPYYPQPEPYTEPEWRKEDYAEPYWPQEPYQYEAGAGAGAEAEAEAEEPRPSITMPGATASRPSLYTDYEDDRPPSADTDRDTDTPKPSAKQESKPKQDQKKGGWLGGIFTKLSLRPPNQMILPDDKNPTIVWDKENKRWQNLDADEDEAARPPPPPPKTHDVPAMQASSPLAPPAAGAPPATPMSNIFKMQKGRHIKKSYVDVFNPSGAPTRPLPPAADVLGPPAPGPAPPYMMPQQFDPKQPEDSTYHSGM